MNRNYLGQDDNDMKSSSFHASSHHCVINQWNSNSANIHCSLKILIIQKNILNAITAKIQAVRDIISQSSAFTRCMFSSSCLNRSNCAWVSRQACSRTAESISVCLILETFFS